MKELKSINLYVEAVKSNFKNHKMIFDFLRAYEKHMTESFELVTVKKLNDFFSKYEVLSVINKNFTGARACLRMLELKEIELILFCEGVEYKDIKRVSEKIKAVL